MPELTLRLDDEDMNRIAIASGKSGYTLDTFMKILLAYALWKFEQNEDFSFAPELAQMIANDADAG